MANETYLVYDKWMHGFVEQNRNYIKEIERRVNEGDISTYDELLEELGFPKSIYDLFYSRFGPIYLCRRIKFVDQYWIGEDHIVRKVKEIEL